MPQVTAVDDQFGTHTLLRQRNWSVRHHPARLIDHGASDGTIKDFGRVHSIFFRDPDGLEGEALIGKD